MNKLVFVFLFSLISFGLNGQVQLQYITSPQQSIICQGDSVVLSVSTKAQLITFEANNIGINTATIGGSILNDGGYPIIERGVCWSTSATPTISDNITTDGFGLGAFLSYLVELSPNTLYYVRAYAINELGVYYGNEVSFVTEGDTDYSIHSCGEDDIHNIDLDYGSMLDQNGNTYKTIVLGNQEWMAENLNTRLYRNGDAIANVTSNSQWGSLTSGAWCYYNNDSLLQCPYGKLYNLYSVYDERNLCPIGWHIPNRAEWDILIHYLGGEEVASGKLKSSGINFWASPNTLATNESGFSALPGGFRFVNGLFYDQGGYSYFASPDYDFQGINYRITYYLGNEVVTGGFNMNGGVSVRCLKDQEVVEGAVLNLNCSSIVTNGELFVGTESSQVGFIVPYSGGNGGSYFSQCTSSTGVSGLIAKLSSGELTNGVGYLSFNVSGVPDDFGLAYFEVHIGGQSCSIALIVNDVVQDELNSHTCGVGNVNNPNLEYGLLTDQEGNQYKTVVIGNQEWMAENLATALYSNGDTIPNIENDIEWANLNIGSWCYFNNDFKFNCPYGKLYNWYSVADIRSLCPSGWHIPNDSDWNYLIDYLGEEVNAGNKLKSFGTQYWRSPNFDANNESGYSGLPGGYRSPEGAFSSIENVASWWSNTETNASSASKIIAGFYSGNIERNDFLKSYGLSIRCIKNNILSVGSINNLDCAQYIMIGSLTAGVESSHVNVTIPYTGGDGGNYNAQSFNSTNITGLTARLTSGTFSNGAGFINLNITGTPSSEGSASFMLNIGGQICELNLTVNNLGPFGSTSHNCGSENIHNPDLIYNFMHDQEGNEYKTIIIGDQEWMAENLKTNIYQNGDPITNSINGSQWSLLNTGAWCVYNNESRFDCPYGKLYNWFTISDPRNICPIGWRVPNNLDWDILMNNLNSEGGIGGKLKSSGTQYWVYPNVSGDNESGFSGLSAGNRNFIGTYNNIGHQGSWWSSDSFNLLKAWSFNLYNNNGNGHLIDLDKNYGFSIRCIKN